MSVSSFPRPSEGTWTEHYPELGTEPVSYADSTIRSPGEHPDYHVDIEPHGVLAFPYWDWGFYGPGVGGGARFSIPLCKNCFIPKINNNVTISFGADFVFYPFVNSPVIPSYLVLPVAMQWNFFVHKKWSVGPEFGFAPTVGEFANASSLYLAITHRPHRSQIVSTSFRTKTLT